MLNPSQIIRAGSAVLNQNAPAILSAFGAIGVVGTAYLAGKASFEAHSRIMEAKAEENVEELTPLECTKLVWPLYVPTVMSGTASVAAILMAQRMNSKRIAMLAAAYALSQDRLEEYQEKVQERLGIKKERSVRDEILQDRINRDYKSGEVLLDKNDSKVLIMEEYTGRFFWSTLDIVNNAVNEINARIISNERSARMSDFYDLIGLAHVSTSDYFGWHLGERLELEWGTGTTPDGTQAVHTFEYVHHPVLNPEREASFL